MMLMVLRKILIYEFEKYIKPKIRNYHPIHD